MIRVVVADDHPIVRSGIVALLQEADDVEVVGQASDGDAAVAVTLAERPDVVLMDLRMPSMNGDAATAQILARNPASASSSSPRTSPTTRSSPRSRPAPRATC